MDVVHEQYGENQWNARCVEEDSGMRYLVGLDEECNITVVDEMKYFLIITVIEMGKRSRYHATVGDEDEKNPNKVALGERPNVFKHDRSSDGETSRHADPHSTFEASSKYFKSAKKSMFSEGFNEPYNSDFYEPMKLSEEGRSHTVSVAIPTSFLAEVCPKKEIRTYVMGQLARSISIFGVDEIVLYNDHCWNESSNANQHNEFLEMMSTILQYQECPQYLRKHLVPKSVHLTSAGLLNPLAAPHHLKANQWCKYREGVVTDRNGKSGSLVDAGLGRLVAVPDKAVEIGMRVTVKLPDVSRVMGSPVGELVSPHEPRLKHGVTWGYTVRHADSLAQVLSECENNESYDYVIGTSDRGTPVQDLYVPKFKKLLVVFGGVAGLEEALSRDAVLTESSPENLFDAYINACPQQQTRTIRTDEAVLLVLATVTPKLTR
ncbi:putative RNA methyltransferase [Trinorchestia longiramus]|nr:putative RNA methyltransferase [Trinorchestia longiramus]